ncbi:MAG: hypothetical protein RL662_2126 [Bacteroidota bacterium]|jgi:hypothetical protein
MQLYTPDNKLLLDIPMDDSSYRLREIMGANSLELKFSLPEFVPIIEGSYCDFMTERYWMPRALDYVKEHSENFSYSLSLEGSINFLKSTKFKFFDYLIENGLIKPTSSFKLKFPITATPRMVAELLVANLKLKYPQYPWAVGDCIESLPIIMDFNHDFCFDVLPKLADTFNTEWEVDKYTIHVRRVERLDENGKKMSIKLSYGYSNGILGGIRRMQFDSKRIINRVYVEGGDRNIDRSTYGNDTLLLPKSRKIVHEGVEYTTDASGSYLERVKPLAGEEDSLDVSKFYPKRVGVVSAVEMIDDKKGFYNIIDEDIPADLDFSKKIIAGETMTLIFQTGQLAGKEFDVKYIHDKRKFELVPIDEGGLIYPQGNIIPAVGDTYAVFHMQMPEQYITIAEDEALDETAKYLWKNEQPQYTYRWQLDGIHAKRNWGEIRGFLNIGFFVEFSDPQFLPEPVDVRIVTVKEMVNDPQSPEITIANNVSSRTLGSVINEIPTQEQATDRKDREVREFARRRWKDTQELIDNIMGMTDEFADNLFSALVFEGLIFRAGAPSLQYRFLAADWVATIEPDLYFNIANKQFHCPPSRIEHGTIEIDGRKPYWEVPAYVSDNLMELNTPYYLYIKASKDLAIKNGRLTGDGTFFISTEKIKLDDLEGFYTFWVAFINSENEEGDRPFTTMFGLAMLSPRELTVDTIRSSDGGSYWKALKNQFKLGNSDNGIDYNVTEEETLTMKNATIREALNVYGEAFIAGFLFSNQVIKSKATTGNLNAMVLDGLNGSLQFNNHTRRWTENGGEETKEQYIRLDSSNDTRVEARNITDGDVAYLSSQGVFANRAGIDTLPASSGMSMKAAIAGLGFGKMDKDRWGSNYGIVGVFGTASNKSANPAPAYGGWFDQLKVNGMILNMIDLTGDVENTTRLTRGVSYVLGNSTKAQHVYLPTNAYKGTVIWFKQWWTGYMRIYAPLGQRLFDDSSQNDYLDVGEGWTAMCTYIGEWGAVNEEKKGTWMFSRFKF